MGSWKAATRWLAALAGVCAAVTPMSAGADGSPIVVTTNQSGVGVNICSSGCVQVVTVVNVSIVMVYVGAPPAASVRLTPRRIDFGAVPRGGSSPVRLVRLVNTGPSPLIVSSTGVTGPQRGDFGIRSTTCTPGAAPAALLQPRAGCTIGVGFTPSAPGRRDATLSLLVNQTAYGVRLTGHSATPGALAASPAGLDFGNVAVRASATRWLTLRNAGESPLTLRSLVVTGDYTLGSDCLRGVAPRILAAQAWCTVRVRFTPRATGARPGTITVGDDAGGGPHVVALTGTGVTVFVPVARAAAAPAGGSGGNPSSGNGASANPASTGRPGADPAPSARSDADTGSSGRSGERRALVANTTADPAPSGRADSDSAPGARPDASSTKSDAPGGQATSSDTPSQGSVPTQTTPVVVPAPQTSTSGQAGTSPMTPPHPRARADQGGVSSAATSRPSPVPIVVPARRAPAVQDASVMATQLASHSTPTSTVTAPFSAAAHLPIVWWFIAVLAAICVACAGWWQRTARARRLCGLLRR